MMKKILALGLSACCFNLLAEPINLEDCHVKGTRSYVKCGTLSVPENYQKPDGKKIDLNLVVLPSIETGKKEDPLFFLAGGPGQAASELVSAIRRPLAGIRQNRDIVFIDQRGTGKSSPLQCMEDESIDVYKLTPEQISVDEVKACIDSYDVDLSQFNTPNAIRDFDQVRQALGYQQVNLYGGSYGTRAALVYMKMFPETIRSVVLDSVGPIEVEIGPFGQSAARSFEIMLDDCKNNALCNETYPELEKEFKALMQRLDQDIRVEIMHPTLANKTELIISKYKFVNLIRQQLYSAEGRSLIPLMIHQAYKENYLPLAGLIAVSGGSTSGAMYAGLTLNIVCNEDYKYVDETALNADGDNSFGGKASHMLWDLACPVWPSYDVEPIFHENKPSNIPTLVLSGHWDPVTPPSNGEAAMSTLTNAKHFVVKDGAHIQAANPCIKKMMKQFVNEASLDNLDSQCLESTEETDFVLGLN